MSNRSLSATSEGIEAAKKVLASKGWTQEYLAGEVGLSSRQSIWKFLSGRPVSRQIFKEICFKLNLDWENIANLPDSLVPVFNSQGNTYSLEVSELVSVMRSHIQETILTQCNALQSSFELTQPPLEKIYTRTSFYLEPSYQRWLEVSDLENSLASVESFRLCRPSSNAVLDSTLLRQKDKLVILGKPGAGKTTFLQHLALQCTQGKYRQDLIPCFIQLRTEWEQGDEELIDFQTYLMSYGKNHGLSHRQIKKLLEEGKFLLLLDALDEVPLQSREMLCKNIQTFSQEFYKNSLIITSRNSAQQFHFRGFTYVEIADLEDNTIKEFVEKWFIATSQNKAEGKKKAQQFLEQLNSPENESIRELAVTPILLNLLCSVFKERVSFPRQRPKLYEAGLDILLQRWDKSRGIERDDFYHDLSLLDKRKLLSKIAAVTFSQGRYFFESREIQEIIEDYLCHCCDFTADTETLWLTSEAVLKSIEIQHGVLVERAKDIYSFSHLTFQEYFTARHIIASGYQSLEHKLTELATKIGDDSWREVILLTISMLPKADVLLLKIKDAIDNFPKENIKLQNYLKLLDEKVEFMNLSYKKSAVRAFYFTLFNHRDFNLALSLEPQFAYQNKLSKEIKLDSTLVRAFIDSLQLVKNPNIKNFLSLCLSLEIEQKFQLTGAILEDFSQLKSQLPDAEQGKDYILNWWKIQGKKWVDNFRIFLMRHRKICYDWELNQQEKDLWNCFYDGNVFLVKCLKGDGNISPKVKTEIESSLLLPKTI
ncbi:NACHT domain-containing NTPase [Cyanothece sp. BG0011]|uniref:NACHT domain-containing protein n=1 Tax=Cyanothece sp. BG0011 TaxID=2082950 RepID=UPI000D1E42B0|nr:NACHT domain-containing NTPase [Cyanothece sp. BG0011]